MIQGTKQTNGNSNWTSTTKARPLPRLVNPEIQRMSLPPSGEHLIAVGAFPARISQRRQPALFAGTVEVSLGLGPRHSSGAHILPVRAHQAAEVTPRYARSES